MGNVVFPGAFAGLKFVRGRYPRFDTHVQTAISGRERRNAYQAFPLWDYKLSYEVLRELAAVDELRTIEGFWLARRGMWDSWLYTDPDDNAVTDQQFGICNGTTVQFQLARAFGYGAHTFTEPVQNVAAITNVKRNGVVLASPADYTVSATGLVTFATAGTSGHALTWTGTFYYRCRFLIDAFEADRFSFRLWELKKLDFRGAPGNKV
jgi:uncharacterized protein (TIGR02217 family)